MNLNLVIAVIFAILTLPAFIFGFQLAIWFDSLYIIPIPAVCTFIIACIFMHRAEEYVLNKRYDQDGNEYICN